MNTGHAFCTIIASNYLASARTLCESLRKFHPNLTNYVLFIDDCRSVSGTADDCFHGISLEEIGIETLDLLRFGYDVVELATVVKPHFLKHLFKKFDLATVVYLDPDILVLNSLDRLLETLGKHNLVLTPHLDTDYPDDGHQPDTCLVLTYGLYNLGFIGCRNSAETVRFLDWWNEKIRKRCTRDSSTAHFVDQKVVDVAPLLFEGVYLERGPGYNAAYWNIHSRTIRFADGRWLANDQPLFFFHFSAFNPGSPEVLSRDCTRPLSKQNHGLLELLQDYRERLIRNGHLATRRLGYAHSRFANGEEILYATRQRFRTSEQLQLEESTPFRSARMIRWNRMTAFKYKHGTIYRLVRKAWSLGRSPILAMSRVLGWPPAHLDREQYH